MIKITKSPYFCKNSYTFEVEENISFSNSLKYMMNISKYITNNNKIKGICDNHKNKYSKASYIELSKKFNGKTWDSRLRS